MAISLRHRAVWVVAGGGAGLICAALLGLGVAGLIGLTAFGAAAAALAVAVNSCLRHSADPEAQPVAGSTVPAAPRSGDPPR